MFKLVKTCNCSPEQYDVFVGDMKVGYIRCRWGQVTVQCPSVGGEVVYQAITEGYGSFTNDERDIHLDASIKAIKLWNERESAKYQTCKKMVDTLDRAVDVIHEYLYGCNVYDQKLEQLAETLDKFVKAYE